MPATTVRRSVGRPRADRRAHARPPREEILFQAARLFASRGFAATTTREIAAAAGLRQPSLFHWFASKQAILEALLDSLLADSLAHAERVCAERASAPARLYRILRFDARHLCASPYDATAIVLSPEAWGGRYRRFWKQRERLVEIVHRLVRAGIRAGAFARVDAELATRILFGMDEGVLTWFERDAGRSPDEVGDALASLALRALLRDPRALKSIRREAAPVAAAPQPGGIPRR